MKFEYVAFSCGLDRKPRNVEVGDDMIIPLHTDWDDDWIKKWSEADGRATDHQKNQNFLKI